MKKYILILTLLAIFASIMPVFGQVSEKHTADSEMKKETDKDDIVILHDERGLRVYAHNQPERLRIQSDEYIKYVELLDERKILKYWQLIEPSKNLILPWKFWGTQGYWLRILGDSGEYVISLDVD